jgi:hypothetical protein
VLAGKFDTKPIDLVISTYQACILMLFNQQVQFRSAFEDEGVEEMRGGTPTDPFLSGVGPGTRMPSL